MRRSAINVKAKIFQSTGTIVGSLELIFSLMMPSTLNLTLPFQDTQIINHIKAGIENICYALRKYIVPEYLPKTSRTDQVSQDISCLPK